MDKNIKNKMKNNSVAKRRNTTRYFNTNQNENQIDDEVQVKNEPSKFPKSKNHKDFTGDKITLGDDDVKVRSKFLNKHKSTFKHKSSDHKLNQQRSTFKPKINPKLLEKHSRGEKADESGVKTNFFKTKLKKHEIYMNYATEQAARTEILLTEQTGYIEPGEGERTRDYRQSEIVKNVDITTASKNFKLNLQFGPYHHRYTKNGRHLLIGGKRGHVAAFDWITKSLHCEINVMEEVTDIQWLHIETMFACAQKKWTFIYDNKGTEIHCIKRLYNINKLEFLPYHFLLAAGSNHGYLSWVDISIGELVGHYDSKLNNIQIMRQNPINGVLCVGGSNGVVSMWTPKCREPVAKMICHRTSISSLAIDPKGNHMVTSGLERKIKVWDIRKLDGPLGVYCVKMPINHMDISQRGLLACSMGNQCHIYSKTLMPDKNRGPYLRFMIGDLISDIHYCPYEDILGISTDTGFTSYIVPGSGQANFDTFEANPYQTKSQRKENEVHALLEKIPAEFITLDPNEIAGVDVETLTEKVNAKKNLFYLRPPQIDFKSRRKMKGKGGSVKAARNKQIVKDMTRKAFIKNIRKNKQNVIQEFQVEDKNHQEDKGSTSASVLDRFKSNKKRKIT